jgi:hypothetical protein
VGCTSKSIRQKKAQKIISDSNLKSSCRHANQPVPIKFSGQFTSKDLVFLKETYVKPLFETSIKAQERSWDDWRFDLRMNFGIWALGPWGLIFKNSLHIDIACYLSYLSWFIKDVYQNLSNDKPTGSKLFFINQWLVYEITII